MPRPHVLSALLALAIVGCAASTDGPPGPVQLTQTEADSVLAVIDKDRVDTKEWLSSGSTSYLAAISRRDFGDAEVITVGRKPDNDLRVNDPAVAENHLKVTVVGDSFHVEAVDPGVTFRYNDEDLREARMVYGGITIGRFSLRLSNQHFPAIIVLDPESDRFAEYKGIDYFPPNLDLRYELPLTPNPEPDTLVIMSSRGNQRRALRVGWFDFAVDGKPARLHAHRLLEPGVGENMFSIWFKDATSGEGSYELGRYLNPETLDNGNYVIDFNMAYSPACAYSPHYNCPIPPKDNVLAVAIEAGEKDTHYMSDH